MNDLESSPVPKKSKRSKIEKSPDRHSSVSKHIKINDQEVSKNTVNA